jgi:two-component system KDP operon response regulator KdpE
VVDLSVIHVLVVDDDRQVRSFLRQALTTEGYVVTEAASGAEALEALPRTPSDAVLLDLSMPGMSGLEACRAIRAISDVVIIVVSPLSVESDKISALDAGADDYIVKPVSIGELLARLRAAWRRVDPQDRGPRAVNLGELKIDIGARRVVRCGHQIHLTRKEWQVSRKLAASPNVAIPYRRLLEAIWGREFGNELGCLRTCVNQLRAKIEPEPNTPRYIITARYVGYYLRTSEDAPVDCQRRYG